jgi:hypothetical protein
MSAVLNGTTITLTGSNTALSIVTDISNTTYAQTLLSDNGSKVYFFNGVRFHFNSGASWTDERAIILHTLNNNDTDHYAFTMADSTAYIEWGYLDETDIDKPVTALHSSTDAGCRSSVLYSFFHNSNKNNWFEENTTGSFKMYGGMLRFINSSMNSGNSVYPTYFPRTVKMIQVNVENIGGIYLFGDSSNPVIIKECSFKNMKMTSCFVNKSTSTTTQTLKDIQFHNSNNGITLDGSNDYDIYGLRFRGVTQHINSVSSYNNTLRLIDSDTLSAMTGTLTFGTSGKVIEATSYKPKTVQTDGQTGEINVRTFCYQKSSGGTVNFGSEQLTDVNGEVTNLFICSRSEMNDSYTSISSKYSYGNFAVRLRKFGKKFMDISKVGGEVALLDSFIIRDNNFLAVNEATASSYTGISLNKITKKLTITTARTLQEIYDYLQYLQKNINELATKQILKTKDGISFNFPDDWTIDGTGYIDLEEKYLINKYVPVKITGIVTGSRCAVVLDGITVVSKESDNTSTNLCVKYSVGSSVYVRVRLAGYKPFSKLITLSPTGNNINANLQIDRIYT